MKRILRPGAFAVLALALLLPAGSAPAQAVIKVNDDVNFKFGFLLQGQGDWVQNANDTTSLNLYLRRVRVLMGGQLAKMDESLSRFLNPPLEPHERKLAEIEGWILGVA